ncbi:unnamed protein product [Haemonchus placei]|uniref:VWFA domain-containing protein n=1 Tax=Haemonchus placei TaxID=6290 RepID=A0A0N4WS23_HAEPC|nr:unnamed protein product [Haemonchus placei]
MILSFRNWSEAVTQWMVRKSNHSPHSTNCMYLRSWCSDGDELCQLSQRLRPHTLIEIVFVASPSTLQCRVDDPLSCSQAKHEVCVFANGQYRCECPTGVNRLPDGRCLSVDECARPSLNGCHKDANCIDKQEGYTCECKPGFADVSPDRTNKPGRICRKTSNECGQRETYGVDCDPNAACVDTPEGFQCVCQPGFADVSTSVSKLPGRKCVEVVNECTTGKADCSCNADCFDRDEGYECKCRPGFVDASPDTAKYPGRVCNRPKSPEYYGQTSRQPQCTNSNQCGPNEECRFNAKGEMVCQCKRGAVQQSDGKCKVFSQCERANECDRNAICSNTYDGFKCQCKAGYIDLSPDPYHLPGRKCEKITNECADGTADCSPYADCIDLRQGYMCKCKMGYTDVSSRYQLQPGRKCSQAANQCSDRKLNSCDDNADCVQLPDGYTCKCFSGYVDVSSNANLEPGRVCTLSTVCPVQATDLVFLIDGSGSIGSYIFQTEVLRFLAEFTELFDIAPDKTRVSVVQYSDQIRHEFGLDDYKDSRSLHEAIKNIEYLTGLTRTGAAIEHVATEAFSERRGARPLSDRVARVAIVITDGRSQDNVTTAANNARRQNIQLFAVGVTNHVLQAELEEITGAKDRTFHVNAFEDLNTRLRSAIQRVTCPQNEAPKPSGGPCDPSSHAGCDRALNQVCMLKNGQYSCTCPEGFEEHPACGGDVCNPEIPTSCPDPEICEKTPFGNWRCTCPADLGWRDLHTGACTIETTKPSGEPKKKLSEIGEPPQDLSESQDECDPADSASCGPNAKCVRGPGGSVACQCDPGYVINIKSDKCQKPGTCDPSVPNSCDARKKEKCLLDSKVTAFRKRLHTRDAYKCQCKTGYVDHDELRNPGRDCRKANQLCESGRHDCDKNAQCIERGTNDYECVCKPGFLDRSPLPHRPVFAHVNGLGRKCLERVCLDDTKHDCHAAAVCQEVDGPEKYTCKCRDGYVDANKNKPGLYFVL